MPSPSHRRLGVFGGTFDPPHVGHLVTALNVGHALGLDEVLMVVSHVPWQKEGSRRITPSEDRFEMVRAAVAGVAGLSASRLEIDRDGPSYTADTLRSLHEAEPDATLFTILGDDAASRLTTWERWDEVVELSRLVVVDRPGDPVGLPDVAEWIRVEVPRLEVSSTDLRARIRDGRPLDYLIPRAVLDVIARRGLYQEAA